MKNKNNLKYFREMEATFSWFSAWKLWSTFLVSKICDEIIYSETWAYSEPCETRKMERFYDNG